MKTPISEMALYSGLRCTTIEIAQPIAMPANKMKSAVSISFSVRLCGSQCLCGERKLTSPQRHGESQRFTERSSSPTRGRLEILAHVIEHSEPLHRRGKNNVDDCGRDQVFPAESHQLIKTKARQSPAQPNIEKQEQDHFAEEVENAEPRQLLNEWTVPAAEKKRRRQHRNGKHVDVFGEEEERELHRAVFSMKAGDQFSFCLRQIKRYAVRLSNRRDQVNDEAERLHPEHVPSGNAQVPRLLFDNAVKIERAGLQNYANQSQAERQFKIGRAHV